MKQSATLITWVVERLISRCRSNVKNYLTVLFLLSGMLFVTQQSDAQCNSFGIDFKQGANRDGGYATGEIHWINSILQQSNSRYIEGMSTLQRIVFDNLPACSGTHTLRIKMEARKGDVHAYDFITSWDNALKAAEAIAPGFGLMPSSRADLDLHECGDEISSCAEDACTLVTGSVFRDLPVISNEFDNPTPKGETNLLIEGPPADQNTTRQVIDAYECRYGDNITIASGVNAGEYDRSVRVYTTGFTGTTGDANNAVYFVGYGDSNPNDGGDTYIYYDIVWSSTSTSVVIEFAAHIAVGVDGLANNDPGNCNESPLGVGYLLNRGASSISGGPYHVIVEDFIGPDGTSGSACEPNLGNQDNQLQGSEILLIPACNLQGPSAACANSTATYTATVTNPDNATNANNSTFLWEIIGSVQSPPPNPAAATFNGATSGNVPQVPAGETSVPLSITVNTGGVGSYTVKLTITNGAATTTTDDDVASSCTVTTTVTGGPTATCPAPSTAAACQTQAQVDALYQQWLASATGLTHNGGTVGPDKCGGSKTVIFTATNTCGTSTCSATFSVTADNTPPGFTGNYSNVPLSCNPAASDISGALNGATATDNCGATTITQSDGAVQSSSCSRSQTRTFTARDGCGNTATVSRTVTWTADVTPPGFTGSYANVPLGCNPTGDQISTALDGATATDGCGPVTISQSDGSVSSSSCGRSQTRTFTARDGCGNTSTVSRTVTWTADNTPPSFTGSYTTVNLGCNPVASDVAGALGSASATDACGPVTITQSDGTIGQTSCGNTQTRTFTARDGCGNTATISRTVNWGADATPPAFTGSYANVPLGCNPAASDINGALNGATATDGCGPVTITQSDGPVGSSSCGRSQTRTFVARDACNNTASTSRTVTWTADVTPPGFTGSYATTPLGCNPAGSDITGALDGATATDACGPVTISQSDGPVNSDGCLRFQTRTFTARDGCGNTATIGRTVTWTSDNTPPVITTGGGSLTLGCNPAASDINNSLGTATATDACGVPTLSSNDGPVGSNGCGRSQTRTWTARDFCGNTSTASRTVTWTADVTPPTITMGGGSLTLGCNPAASDINNSLGTSTATDACGVPTTSCSDGNVTSDGCTRTQTRTCTARDACGNTATASRTVTWTVDVTPPGFTGSYNDVQLGCNPAASDINTALDGATATDGCGPVTISQSDGSVASNGCNRSQARTFTARDGCGNTATVSRTVRWIADVTPPFLSAGGTGPALGCNPSASDINSALGTAVATDACSTPTITQVDGSVQSSSCGRSQTRTWTARDACGNTSTTSRTATWTADVTPPTFTNCPAPVTQACGTTPQFGTPTASDACSVPTVTQLGDDVVAGTCPTTTTRKWVARDACGNTSTCSQTITVPCCAANCTYTQGKYGQDQDVSDACDGTTSSNNPYSPSELIEHNLLAYGGLLRVGCPGHSVTIATGQAQCVIAALPGGGQSGPLAAGDFSICNLPASYLKGGRINNALLAQTITLGLNLGINPAANLGGFALQVNKWLVTADLTECGSTTVASCEYDCTPNLAVPGTYIWSVSYNPYHVTDCRISQALYDALTTKDVNGLYALANSALCGNALPAGVSYSDITKAVDCINNAFDECRSFIEWKSGDRPSEASYCPLPSATTPCPVLSGRMITRVTPEVNEASELTVSAYPNPFRDQVRFIISSRVSGQASLEVYNMLGQRIQTVYTGTMVAGRAHIVDFEAPRTVNGGLIYIFKQNGKQVTGKLLNIE